ncbi:MAG TPA: hypothetical protein VHW23_24760 [Kofleriaceae bacterium]|jgi:hypothetical protein|nr:hypothetical protein [Kofleriaceae bacterium]
MKLAVTLAVLAFAGCATAVDPEPSATSSTDQASVVPTGLPSTNTTCQWQIDESCYGQLNNANNLWPPGIGITSAFVMTRSGPPHLVGRVQTPTFLAFVVWNDSVIGRIFRIDVGSTDNANFDAVVANTFVVRTFNLPDTSAGSSGATSGGPSPPPHPNVDGSIVFDPGYLSSVAGNAAIVRRATADFLATRSAAID